MLLGGALFCQQSVPASTYLRLQIPLEILNGAAELLSWLPRPVSEARIFLRRAALSWVSWVSEQTVDPRELFPLSLSHAPNQEPDVYGDHLSFSPAQTYCPRLIS